MASATAAPRAPKTPKTIGGSVDRTNLRWPIGFAIAAVVVFVFYGFILPNLGESIQDVFRNWLPLDQINLALIWAMSALGSTSWSATPASSTSGTSPSGPSVGTPRPG